jgi:acyl-CoA thioesterase FadM
MLTAQQHLTIRFEDADPAGVIFYPRAITLAHNAVEDLIRHSTLGWDAWFGSPTHAAPLRRAEAEFFLPMRPGETVTTRAAVEKIGTTSVTFRVDFLDAQNRLAATISTTHVLVEKGTGRAVPLADNMRAAFQA